MPIPATERFPENEDELARVAADTNRPGDARREAFERLAATIAWVAQRVSLRFAGQRQKDAEADAPADIWRVIHQFPSDGRFEPWCYAVLRNRWLDAARGEERRRRVETAVARPPEDAADFPRTVGRALDSAAPLCPADLARVGTWPNRVRIILLALSGLWAKVPGAEWESWVREHRDGFGTPVAVPFPPASLARCDTLSERNETLAAALGVRRNTLSVILSRGRSHLRELQCVRDLLGLEGGKA